MSDYILKAVDCTFSTRVWADGEARGHNTFIVGATGLRDLAELIYKYSGATVVPESKGVQDITKLILEQLEPLIANTIVDCITEYKERRHGFSSKNLDTSIVLEKTE